jgi:hypothetical protein
MKRIIAGLATALFVCGGLGLAGLGAGIAYADPQYQNPPGPFHWCPGQPLPAEAHGTVNWDMAICHDYYLVVIGHGNAGGLYNNIWDGPNPPHAPMPCGFPWDNRC